MMTCADFKNVIITRDPYFPPVLWYRDDPGNPPDDPRWRQQAPYPLNGISYNESYHNNIGSSYAFEVVPGSLVVTLGVDYNDPENLEPIAYPATEGAIVMPMNLDPDMTLIDYFSGWDSTGPFDLDNPPLIPSLNFANGMLAYWDSCTFTHRNVVDIVTQDPDPLLSSISVVKNLTPLSAIQTYMDANSISSKEHDLLCTETKARVLDCTWDITETHLDPDLSDPEALPEPIVDTLDTSVSISYSVRLKEV